MSHHHPAQLNSVVKTLVTRSLELTDNEYIPEETENIGAFIERIPERLTEQLETKINK